MIFKDLNFVNGKCQLDYNYYVLCFSQIENEKTYECAVFNRAKLPVDLPSVKTEKIKNNKIRIGGMVKENSIKIKSTEVNFIITDFKNEINVTFSGAVPNLFSEGKGVVAEGYLKDRSFFEASKILAKHDENYMPPEVKEALGKK